MSDEGRATALEALSGLLQRERVGALATLSKHLPGWPFASMTPFALTDKLDPVLVLSDLAEHAKNLQGDPRASLLVTDRAAADDPQTGLRATLVGPVCLVDDAELDDLKRRWESRLPGGRSQLWSRDFRVYVLRTEHVRFIGGFGAIRWLSGRKALVPGLRAGLGRASG